MVGLKLTSRSEEVMIAQEEGCGWTSSEESLDGSPPTTARMPRKFLAIGTVLLAAGLVVVVVAATHTTPPQSTLAPITDKSAWLQASSEDVDGECADAFKQCGGAKFHGTTCCKLGCTCEEQGEYFSGCKPSGGVNHCSLEAGVGQFEDKSIAKVKVLVLKAKKAHDAFEDAAKVQEGMLVSAHAALVAAEKARKTIKAEERDKYAQAFHAQVQASKQAKMAGLHASRVASDAAKADSERVKASNAVLKWLEKAGKMEKRVPAQGHADTSASSTGNGGDADVVSSVGSGSGAESSAESSESDTNSVSSSSYELDTGSSETGSSEQDTDRLGKEKHTSSSRADRSASDKSDADDEDDSGGASFQMINAE